jgi:hypothetical protein
MVISESSIVPSAVCGVSSYVLLRSLEVWASRRKMDIKKQRCEIKLWLFTSETHHVPL